MNGNNIYSYTVLFFAGDRLLLERETSSNKELLQESQRRFLCLVIQFSFLAVVQR